ncbi:MAG: glucose-specific PTS transporter subunit IIBC, partial [Endozoicomonas sp.]
FSNLPLIFAIGTAIGLTENDGVSSVAAVVGFCIMLGTMGVMANHLGLEPSDVMGINTIDTGVFGGILVGILAANMFNRYYKIQLPDYLGFFAGKRFVPIITGISAIILGVILSFIWPPIQSLINVFSEWAVTENPEAAGFVYGFVERLLIPFGLHHIWNVPFQIEMGEFIDTSGTVFNGDIARFFAGDPTAGFLAGGYLFKMFGLPAAAIAIWHCAKPENRAKAGGIMVSAALTSILTGITEPIEFSFLFVAPILYGIHAILAGIAFAITNFLDIKMAMSFSNGLIDYVLYFGIATKPVWILILGTLYAVIYYIIFRLLITVMNLKTPGREDENECETKIEASSDLAVELIQAFGGKSNIKSLDACITRLRVSVNNTEIVNTERIKQLGATAVLVVGQNMQAIFGPKSDNIKTEMNEAMKHM